MLGIGFCLGTFLWLIRDFGRNIIPWFALYCSLVLGIAYALEKPLWDVRKVEADHTHAFDDLSSPFEIGRDSSPARMRLVVRTKLSVALGLSEELALSCLFSLLGAGAVLRIADPRQNLDRWLLAKPSTSSHSRWDPHLSGVFVGGSAITGLIVFSVVGAYIYFPKREFCLERMRYLSADTRDLVRHRLADESIRSLEQWDLVARQLQVGVYIRDFHVTPWEAKSVDDLREAIEGVRDDLRARKMDQAKRKLDQIVLNGEYRACVRAYSSEPMHSHVG